MQKMNITQSLRRCVFCLVQGGIIAAFVIAMAIPFSCRISEEGVQIVGGDFSSPVLQKVEVIDSKTVRFDFSEPVKLSGIVVSPRIPGISDSERISFDENLAPSLASAAGEYGRIDAEISVSEDKKCFTLIMVQETSVGKSYEVYGVVEDEIGNSLTFCVPFTGYNSRIPRMIMTELQIKYGKGTVKGETIYRGEYVECLALEDGNLAGLVLESASDGPSKNFEFPALDVKKGEIILIHLRTVGDGCISEIDEDLNLATAPHSAEGKRDLWSENTSARLNDNSDVIILRDCVNNIIMDAVMYASVDASEWKSNVAEYAVEAEEAGLYASSEISNASSSKGCTTLKSLTRNNAVEILNLITENSENDYEFPFQNDADTWGLSPCTPGVF